MLDRLKGLPLCDKSDCLFKNMSLENLVLVIIFIKMLSQYGLWLINDGVFLCEGSLDVEAHVHQTTSVEQGKSYKCKWNYPQMKSEEKQVACHRSEAFTTDLLSFINYPRRWAVHLLTTPPVSSRG